MSIYNINFSDPLRSGFVIAPGGFNGPGGASVSSALRLYGRGALEWGEAVDENMLRTLELFNGATPPPFALGGQMWFQTKFYWLRTGFTWYLLDPDVPGTWVDIGPTGTNVVVGGIGPGPTPAPPPVIGTYWYTGGPGLPVGNDAFGEPLKANTLYLFEQYGGGQSVAANWIERTNSEATAAPVNGVDYPERSLLVWDEFTEAWVSPPISIVADTAPTNPLQGSLWWDTVGDDLYVWNDDTATWEQIVTVPYANGPAGYIQKGGDTMTGSLTITPGTGSFVADAFYSTLPFIPVPGFANVGDPTTGMGFLAPGVITFFSLGVPIVTFGPPGTISFGGNVISDVGTPLLPTDAATKGYIDSVVASGFASVSTGGTPAHEPGDIYINTGTGRIWIAVTTATSSPTFFASDGSDANWKQVFPALYS